MSRCPVPEPCAQLSALHLPKLDTEATPGTGMVLTVLEYATATRSERVRYSFAVQRHCARLGRGIPAGNGSPASEAMHYSPGAALQHRRAALVHRQLVVLVGYIRNPC